MKDKIVLQSISKKYGNFNALDHVNLDLTMNKIVGLCGPNGSGKTTLIKIIMGLIRDYQGSISYFGEPFTSEIHQNISFLPDKPYFEPNMRGVDSIEIYKNFYKDFNLTKMYDLLSSLELNPELKFRQMSKGMIEKFQLALVLSRDTKVYILDEPIAGVDPASREKIINTILNAYQNGSLLIMSTHIISEIEHIFDEVIFLKNGKIIEHRNTKELVEEKGMSVDAYFREVFR